VSGSLGFVAFGKMLSVNAVTVIVSVGSVAVAPTATVCAVGAEATGLPDVDWDDTTALGLEELPADEHPTSKSAAARAVAPYDRNPVRPLAT
jgi:hypothetical protein